MAFVYWSKNQRLEPKIDIVFIPAIGADPRETFNRQPDQPEHQSLEWIIFDRLQPTAHIHLYDHLTEGERATDVPRRQSCVDTGERTAFQAYLDKEKEVAEYGVKDWAERLLVTMKRHRRERGATNRPMVFICHSTGGNVLKQALTEKPGREPNEIASNTLAITFFAVPHHGSSVLSRDQYVREVQAQLRLKWRMSSRLRQDFRLRDYNNDLEVLNHRFAMEMIGVKIYSYAESADTHLKLLTSARVGGEQPTVFRECIVDSRSGKLGTPQVPVEDEEFMQLDVNHVELPRFNGQDDQLEFYLQAIEKLVDGYNDTDRMAFRTLKTSIMREVKVHIHQFYGDDNQMKIILAKPTLDAFLQTGPDKAMSERLEGRDTDLPTSQDVDRPKFSLHPASEPKEVPTFRVETVDTDRSSNEDTPDRLTPPSTPVPKNIHTHRPPELRQPKDVVVTRSLGPGTRPQTHSKAAGPQAEPKAVKFAIEHKEASDFPPKQSASLQLPDKGNGFRWIHVPFTHPGWVHQILGVISQGKGNLKLHSQVLRDKIWFSQHNQSRHASPHARFVRPSVKFLFPEGMDNGDRLKMLSSSCKDVQTVVYLPYLHWDSFTNMKKRADTIRRRLNQSQTGPIPRDILTGKSTEHKLIWQCLTLDRPLHCRRTLDQYGYPALRNTTVRDHDQVLWKRTAEEKELARNFTWGSNKSGKSHQHLLGKSPNHAQSARAEPENHVSKVLMVDQLWLWIIDEETVVTFFPGRENDNQDGYSREGDVRSLIYQDINGDFANRCNDPYDFAALAIRHAIRALLAKTNERNLQVFRIFEEYISIITEQQNSAWKKFRDQQDLPLKDINSEEHINNKADLNALLELRDIEDELNTIEKLVREQTTLVTDMLTHYTTTLNPLSKGLKGTEFLTDISSFLSEQSTQVSSMRESTSAAQSAYKDLVDMKQKQANVLEARLAGRQSQVAARQSRAVLIFTIFTIIFLPLSFFASVFGINSAEWSDEGTHYLPLSEIFAYMLAISLGCVIIALLAAFSRSARRRSILLWRHLGGRLSKLIPSSLRSPEDGERVGFLGRSSWDDSQGGDPEKEAAAVQVKTNEGRLSTLSRTQSMGYFNDKYENDMQRKGGSVTGWWAHDSGRGVDGWDAAAHKGSKAGVNGFAC